MLAISKLLQTTIRLAREFHALPGCGLGTRTVAEIVRVSAVLRHIRHRIVRVNIFWVFVHEPCALQVIRRCQDASEHSFTFDGIPESWDCGMVFIHRDRKT